MTAVDLFSGAGGFTTGAMLAGVRVLWCANHWPAAISVHASNHTGVIHSCQDLRQADWSSVPSHDILLGSPACQGHSNARGRERPSHDADRSTAWAMVACAEFHRPTTIVVENVPEFARWILYPVWTEALIRLGYSLSSYILDAADFGVPQNRRRLFIVASLGSPFRFRPVIRPHVAAESILHDGPMKWTRLSDKCLRTRSRAARGRQTHGRRFLMPYYGSGSGLCGRSTTRPLGTVTTVDRWALVDGDYMRMLSVDEYRAAMAFPAGYHLPANKRLATHLLGNAVCPPVATEILSQILSTDN